MRPIVDQLRMRGSLWGPVHSDEENHPVQAELWWWEESVLIELYPERAGCLSYAPRFSFIGSGSNYEAHRPPALLRRRHSPVGA